MENLKGGGGSCAGRVLSELRQRGRADTLTLARATGLTPQQTENAFTYLRLKQLARRVDSLPATDRRGAPVAVYECMTPPPPPRMGRCALQDAWAGTLPGSPYAVALENVMQEAA